MPKELQFGEERFTRRSWVAVLVLVIFVSAVGLVGLGTGPWLGDHEAIVAQSAREVRQTGDWLVPHFNGEPRIRKTPLAIWLTALSSYVIDPPALEPPVSPRAARLPSAVAAVLTTLLVYALGRSIFGHRAALVGGAVLATSVGGQFFSHNAQVEMVLTLLVTASFAFFWFGTDNDRKRRWVYLALFYISFALAMLAKAPLPLALVGLPLAVWWLVVVPLARLAEDPADEGPPRPLGTRTLAQLRALRRLWLLPGIALFLLLFLPWPIYVYCNVDHASALWQAEYVQRFTGEMSAKGRPFWYYAPIALGMMLPFSLSLPEALGAPFLRYYRAHRKALLFVFTWVAVSFVFVSGAGFKRPHYLACCVPGLALLLGPTLERLFLAARTFSATRVRVATVAGALATVGGLGAAGLYYWNRDPELVRMFYLAALVLAVGIVVSCVAFAKRRRVVSLLVLHLTAAVSFACVWDALARSNILGAQASTMTRQFEANSIGPDDPVTWVIGRPNAQLAYYSHRQIKPLFSPLEVAAERELRRSLPRELLEAGRRRLVDRLASDQQEYFIIPARYWSRFRAEVDLPAREVARVAGPSIDRGKTWVLITNPWNIGDGSRDASVGQAFQPVAYRLSPCACSSMSSKASRS